MSVCHSLLPSSGVEERLELHAVARFSGSLSLSLYIYIYIYIIDATRSLTPSGRSFLPLPDLDEDMCLMLPMPSPGLSSQSTLLPPGVSRSEFEDDLSALEELMRS